MSDKHDSLLFLFLAQNLQKKVLQENPVPCVDSTEGLIKKQYLRLHSKRSCYRGSLLHTARKLIGILLPKARQPHLFQIFLRNIRSFLVRRFGESLLDTEGDIFISPHPREQRIMLEDNTPVSACSVAYLSINQILSFRWFS